MTVLAKLHRLLGNYRPPSYVDLRDLLTARQHSIAVVRERVNLIVSRTRQIAGVFALLTVVWIAVDALTLPWPQWGEIALGRIFAALAFAALASSRINAQTAAGAYLALGWLVATPLLFFLFSASMLVHGQGDGESLTAITAYYYSPFLVAAGLSIFPLTAVESAAFAMPVILVVASAMVNRPDLFGTGSAVATVWRVFLITGISGLAGMSQLRFLLVLSEQATRDGLTNFLVRRVGEEILSRQFSYGVRHEIPLSVLFFDLDNFKEVNDRFGHEVGDAVLHTAAVTLGNALRHEDIPIRWGGEEFLIALPGINAEDAEKVVRRMAAIGIGSRPDGAPMTASIGIAERRSDAVGNLHALFELADKRMYAAKRAGRNRYVFHDEPKQWL